MAFSELRKALRPSAVPLNVAKLSLRQGFAFSASRGHRNDRFDHKIETNFEKAFFVRHRANCRLVLRNCRCKDNAMKMLTHSSN